MFFLERSHETLDIPVFFGITQRPHFIQADYDVALGRVGVEGFDAPAFSAKSGSTRSPNHVSCIRQRNPSATQSAPVRPVAPGLTIPRIAAHLRLHAQTARDWVKRFNQNGLSGLDDLPRPGKPPTYTAKERAEVVALTLVDPQTLDLPFACWTLDRLVAYLGEQKQISIQRSRVSELLVAEGLRWRTQETWFGERVDPDFAEKKGASKRSTPNRPTAVS